MSPEPRFDWTRLISFRLAAIRMNFIRLAKDKVRDTRVWLEPYPSERVYGQMILPFRGMEAGTGLASDIRLSLVDCGSLGVYERFGSAALRAMQAMREYI